MVKDKKEVHISFLWEDISHIIFMTSYDILFLFFIGTLESMDSFAVLRKRVSPCIYSQVSVTHMRVNLEGFFITRAILIFSYNFLGRNNSFNFSPTSFLLLLSTPSSAKKIHP